jgi:hypothetical protein
MKTPMRIMSERLHKMLQDTGGAPTYQDIENMIILSSDLEEKERQIIMTAYMDGIYDHSSVDYNMKHPSIYYKSKYHENFDE